MIFAVMTDGLYFGLFTRIGPKLNCNWGIGQGLQLQIHYHSTAICILEIS